MLKVPHIRCRKYFLAHGLPSQSSKPDVTNPGMMMTGCFALYPLLYSCLPGRRRLSLSEVSAPVSLMPGSWAKISHTVMLALSQSGTGMEMLGSATVRLRLLKLGRLEASCICRADTKSAWNVGRGTVMFNPPGSWTSRGWTASKPCCVACNKSTPRAPIVVPSTKAYLLRFSFRTGAFPSLFPEGQSSSAAVWLIDFCLLLTLGLPSCCSWSSCCLSFCCCSRCCFLFCNLCFSCSSCWSSCC
mmetsp:Transcript_17246/g.47826  ORF Transcript_17246/g.47826 Transcript_17246/m.47826 type:complete len:244 (+) Transcript_17246:994-1725(+)